MSRSYTSLYLYYLYIHGAGLIWLPLPQPQVQQGQVGTYTDYATPLEYMITPEIGDCTYDEQRATTKTDDVQTYVDGITDKYATGIAPINFNVAMAPEINVRGVGIKGPSASAGTTFSSLSGNSYEVRRHTDLSM